MHLPTSPAPATADPESPPRKSECPTALSVVAPQLTKRGDHGSPPPNFAPTASLLIKDATTLAASSSPLPSLHLRARQVPVPTQPRDCRKCAHALAAALQSPTAPQCAGRVRSGQGCTPRQECDAQKDERGVDDKWVSRDSTNGRSKYRPRPTAHERSPDSSPARQCAARVVAPDIRIHRRPRPPSYLQHTARMSPDFQAMSPPHTPVRWHTPPASEHSSQSGFSASPRSAHMCTERA